MTIITKHIVEIDIVTKETDNQTLVDKVNGQVDILADFFFSDEIVCDEKIESTRPAIAGWMKSLECECDILQSAQDVEFKLLQFIDKNCNNLIVKY